MESNVSNEITYLCMKYVEGEAGKSPRKVLPFLGSPIMAILPK